MTAGWVVARGVIGLGFGLGLGIYLELGWVQGGSPGSGVAPPRSHPGPNWLPQGSYCTLDPNLLIYRYNLFKILFISIYIMAVIIFHSDGEKNHISIIVLELNRNSILVSKVFDLTDSSSMNKRVAAPLSPLSSPSLCKFTSLRVAAPDYLEYLVLPDSSPSQQ